MTQERIGRYQVLEEIASGGQATVYRVWDTQTGQVLALKVMHPHLARDSSYVERFQREARLAASIDHPNVIKIYEVGEENGRHFMALEFLPLSLHHLIQAQGRMPLERAVDIAHQVALGLEAAREKGVVHRDIKPQNILIGPEGTAKVTDFGIGRATDLSTMTRTGAVMGTPHYMSPEQAQGHRVDIRADLYSLGIALYQMLTGELPFEADTPWEVIRRHIDTKPPPVRRGRPDVPRAVESVVERCLEKNPDRRYSTPLELAQALERAMPSAISTGERARAAMAPSIPPSAPAPPSAPPVAPPSVAAPSTPPRAAPVRPAPAVRPRRPSWFARYFVGPVLLVLAALLVLGSVRLTEVEGQEFFLVLTGLPALLAAAYLAMVRRPMSFGRGFSAFLLTVAGVALAFLGGAVAQNLPIPAPPPIEANVLWETNVPGGAKEVVGTDWQGLYAISGDGVIYSFDRYGGNEQWRSDARGPVSGAVLGRDRLYVGIAGGLLVGFDRWDGFPIFESDLGGVRLFPAIGYGDDLYVARDDGTVFRVPPEGGPPHWSISVGRGIMAPPVVGPDGTVYVGTVEPGSIHAISPEGQELWSQEIGPVMVSPAVGSLYVATEDGVLWAFEGGGSPLWKEGIGGRPLAPPAVAADGSVYVLREKGLLVRFSKEGARLWDIEVRDAKEKGLAVGPDGTAYVLSWDRQSLWAVDPDGNADRLLQDMEARWLVMGPEGMLYLGGPSGVTALQVTKERPAPRATATPMPPKPKPTPTPMAPWPTPTPAPITPPAGRELGTFPVGDKPQALAFDGEALWVANGGDGTVTKLARDGRELGTFPVGGGPTSLLFDGESIWVTVMDGNVVTRFSLDGRQHEVFPVGDRPLSLAFDGEAFWVANAGDGTVTKLYRDGREEGTFPVYTDLPLSLAFDGESIWVSNHKETNTLTRLALDGRVMDTIPVKDPHSPIFDGENIWVANHDFNIVTKLSRDGRILGEFPVGKGPWALAFDGQTIWVAHEGDGTVIRLSLDGRGIDKFPVGRNPQAIAFDGEAIWVANTGHNTVTKLATGLRPEYPTPTTPVPTPTIGGPQYGGVLRLALPQDPFAQGFSPYEASSFARSQVNSLLFSRLFRYRHDPGADPFDLTLEPDLVQGWEVSPDGTEYTFKLRRDVRFHDGKPLTARDLAVSLKMMLELPLAGFRGMRDNLRGMDTIDEYAVRVEFHQPYFSFPELLASRFAVIIPEWMPGQGVADPGQLIGTGPFRVKDYQPDKMLVLERNYDYFQEGLPYVDAVELYFMPDQSTRLDVFKGGDVDFFGLLPHIGVPAGEEQPLVDAGAVFYDVQAPAYALWFDTQSPPFDDDRVRQAVSLAVEPERWAEEVLGGWAPYQSAVPQVYFPQWGLSHEEVADFNNYDPRGAKKLLAEAGYPDGFETALYLPSYIDHRGAEVLAKMLEQAGVRVHIKPLSVAELNDMMSGGYQGMAYAPLLSVAMDIDTYLFSRFSPESPWNYSRIEDGTINELLWQQRQASDQGERYQIIKELQYILAREMYLVPLPVGYRLQAHHQRVQGFEFQGDYDLGAMLEKVWLGEGVPPEPTPIPQIRIPPRPPTPTPTPEPSAFVLFEDSFEGGVLKPDWRLSTGSEAAPGDAWRLAWEEGIYQLVGEGHAHAQIGDAAWTDYRVETKVRVDEGSGNLNFRTGTRGRYSVKLPNVELWTTRPGGGQHWLLVEGSKPPLEYGRWYEVWVVVSGDRIEVYVDGRLALAYTDPDPLPGGLVNFESHPKSVLRLAGVRVLGGKDLFPEPAYDLWAGVGAHFYGPASVPPEKRDNYTIFNFWARGATNLHAVRVTLPDGTSLMLSPYGDVLPPAVDPTAEVMFRSGEIPGTPPPGATYVFTGLDANGEPIPGIETAVTRKGVQPPDPPANVSAQVTADGLMLTWDPVPSVPGSFDPGRQIGGYPVNVYRWEGPPGEVYQGVEIFETSHLIPLSWEGFGPSSLGSPLSEWGDGIYQLVVGAHAIDSEGPSGGTWNHSNDPGEHLFITIKGGAVVNVGKETPTHNLMARVVMFFQGSASLSPQERDPYTSFLVQGEGPTTLAGVQVTLPDGKGVMLPRDAEGAFFGADWVTNFRFSGSVPGVPPPGTPGKYVFTGLDANGTAIPGIEIVTTWKGTPPPAPPGNLAAYAKESGIAVTWDAVPGVPGSFDPPRGVGRYFLSVWKLSTEGVRQNHVYHASRVLQPSYLIPMSPQGIGPGDFGSPVSQWPDGIYELIVYAEGMDSKGSDWESAAGSVDYAQDLFIAVKGGQVVGVEKSAAAAILAPAALTDGGWTVQQYPDYGLNAIAFVDTRNGWAVGERGAVLHTRDGGESWEWQDSGTNRNLLDVVFIDASNGWAVGHGGTIIHTSNGGQSWEQQDSGIGEEWLNGAVFTDASNGWAVGNNGIILHTSDGGASWQRQDSGTNETLHDVTFIDASQGWAVGENGTVLRTTDGGASWWRSDVGGLRPPLRAVTFVDAQNGWVVAEYEGFVFRTTNGGVSWRRYTTEPAHYLIGVDFADASNGWAVGHWGAISHTSDGGESWTSQHEFTGEFLQDVVFVNSQEGWVVGQFGSILHTADGGQSWITQRQGGAQDIYGVSFIDASQGWAAGDGGLVLHTSNAGASWEPQPHPPHPHLQDVAFADVRNGSVVSWETLYTRDGGLSWSKASGDALDVNLRGVTFADGLQGWAVGQGGTILHTTDGGATWKAQISGSAAELYDVAFIDANNGWVVGGGGAILHTSDGGASWQAQSSGTRAWLRGVAFVDASNGWVVGDDGTILHTDDGGRFWVRQESGVGEWLWGVTFTDASNGWVVGNNGIILHTTDGGKSWQRQVSYVDAHLFDVIFPDPHHGWAVGQGGVILYYQALPVTDSWELYVKTGRPRGSDIPTPDDFGEYQGLVADAETLLQGISGDYYAIYGLRTWVYVDRAVTIPVVVSGDDSAGLYVNGQLVATTQTPYDRAYGEITLEPGWSEIEALVNDHGGGGFSLSFDRKLGDYVDKMEAKAPASTTSTTVLTVTSTLLATPTATPVPSVTGFYQGTVVSWTFGTSAFMEMQLQQEGDTLSGYGWFYPPFAGEGPLKGKVSGNQLTIEMQATYAGVSFVGTFTGTVSPDGNTLGGDYFVPATGEIGAWEVTRIG